MTAGGPDQVLDRRRIYILPTREGLGFGLVLCVMLLGSINYDNSLGFAMTFLLGSLAMVSTLHAHRSLSGLTVRWGGLRPGFAGGEAGFDLLIDNPTDRPRHGLKVRHALVAGTRHGPGDRVFDIDVPANETTRVIIRVPAARRGLLAAPRVSITSRYPFGWFRAWSVVRAEARCPVYPRPVGNRNLPVSALDPRPRGGARGSGADDFIGFRDYRPGDSPRHIHWRAVARGHGTPVKLFGGAEAAEVLLSWQAASGSDESRLSQLCRWVLEANERGIRFALEIPGTRLSPGLGEGHRAEALRSLAVYGQAEPA